VPQSGICSDEIKESYIERTMGFVEAAPSHVCEVDSEMDSTRYNTADSDTTLSNFFERPVIIHNVDWTVGGNINFVINPWDLWFKNKRVANRLTNYKNFKGKLHIKILLNGNPFYWGRAFVSYAPLNDSPYLTTTRNVLYYLPALHRPHIFLDPSSSDGGEMVLPFFHYWDSLDMTQADVGVDMGELWFNSLFTLQHTQNLTNPINIVVMAWATEVDLSTPTQTVVAGLAPQAGDEYGSGVVSRPANLVAALASKVIKAPIIGPYAMATQLAASAVSNIAVMFGYSRPRIIDPPKPVRISENGDFACTDQHDMAQTTALTLKQEVTIDPRVCGLSDVDELDFDYLNQKYSYLTQTEWTSSDSQYTMLMSFPVTPSMYAVRQLSFPASKVGVGFSTTGFIANCFRSWRGSMTYRFQVVSSGFHRGRLLIVWDPVQASTVPELNTVYSKIVDIADQKDFEITIGWGSNWPGLETTRPLETGPPVIGTDAFRTDGLGYVADPTKHNGVVTMYVLNELVTSGANTTGVGLILHSCSRDMHYWNPINSGFIKATYDLQPQSGLLAQSGALDPGTELVTPSGSEDIGEVGGSITPQSIMSFCAGEVVTTFRTCLKRYSRYRSVSAVDDMISPNSLNVFKFTGVGGFFPPRGAKYAAKGGDTWPMTIQGLVAACYAGFRGSTRVKVVPRASTGWSTPLYVSRTPNVTNSSGSLLGINFTTANINNQSNLLDGAWNGMQSSNNVNSSALQFEIPWYAMSRFALTTLDGLSGFFGYTVSRILPWASSTEGTIIEAHDVFIATGEDYNLFFFLGIHPLWYSSVGF